MPFITSISRREINTSRVKVKDYLYKMRNSHCSLQWFYWQKRMLVFIYCAKRKKKRKNSPFASIFVRRNVIDDDESREDVLREYCEKVRKILRGSFTGNYLKLPRATGVKVWSRVRSLSALQRSFAPVNNKWGGLRAPHFCYNRRHLPSYSYRLPFCIIQWIHL